MYLIIIKLKKQFKSILDTNPDLEINGATTDEGTGLCSSIEESFPFITRQPDTYHGVAHVFGLLRASFEKKVDMAIKKERERDRVCMGRKTDKLFEEKYELYQKALDQTVKAIEEYVTSHFSPTTTHSNLNTTSQRRNFS